MKVLIIGGMGVIGGAITEAAAKKSEMDVYVCSRRHLFGKYLNLRVKGIQGDWRDDSFAKHIVADNYDVIVDTQIFTKKQLIRTMSIVNGHCTQFVYISTDSVYVHPAKGKTEDDPIDLKQLKWKYGFDKRDAELYLESHSNDYSFYWTVIRPTVTFGDTRLPVGFASKRDTNTLVNRILDGKPVILFDDINTKHSICHTSIFGSAVANLFLNENAKNQAFHVSDDKAYTYLEVFHTIEDILGIKGNYVHLSSRYLKKYNKNIYEEMIYDKDPEFTLDNTKIKTVSPETNYHPDIHKILKSTVTRLKQTAESDSEYEILTDLLLLKYKKAIKNDSEKEITEKYITSLRPEYKTELQHYGLCSITQNALKPIKRFCLIPFRISRKIGRFLIKKYNKVTLIKNKYGGYNDYTDKQGGLPKIGFGPDSLEYVLSLRRKNGRSLLHRAYNKFHRICIDKPQYVNAIASSFTIGYRLLDYSAAYGDGLLLREAMKKAGVSRRDIIITTRISNKAQFNGTIEEEVKSQLAGFDTDYLDVLMFHWPVTDHFEETWLKMIEYKKQGLCRMLGVANCNIHHLQRLYEVSGEYPEINQVEVHPLFTQEELRKFCKEKDIIIESYSPTARHDDRLYNPFLLKEMSEKYNRSITQLILRWHVQNGLIPVIRSWNPEHLKSDFDIFDFEISEEDMKEIDNLNINSRIRYDPDNCDFHSL